jgi:hypothetical protein
VNPAKREYLDPGRFGSGAKFNNLLVGETCDLAIKYLIAETSAGWWVGDPVVLAADDTGLPNPAGLKTATPADPGRNLYFQARQEFTDISYRALAFLGRNAATAAELAETAARHPSLLLDLGAVLDEYGVRALEIALERAVGRPWRKAHNKAAAECPYWRPLPHIGWGRHAAPQTAPDRGGSSH